MPLPDCRDQYRPTSLHAFSDMLGMSLEVTRWMIESSRDRGVSGELGTRARLSNMKKTQKPLEPYQPSAVDQGLKGSSPASPASSARSSARALAATSTFFPLSLASTAQGSAKQIACRGPGAVGVLSSQLKGSAARSVRRIIRPSDWSKPVARDFGDGGDKREAYLAGPAMLEH